MGQWLFARQQADDDRSEAKEETLFQDDQSGEDEYAGSDSLVREIAKTGVELGRHGLGKTVFRAVSRTGCMFGLTVRQSDRRQLLMGKAFLHLHEYQGTEYKANGYWCHKSDDVGLALPIENPLELNQFVQEWKLRRRDEPGLSAVSPFVSDQLRVLRTEFARGERVGVRVRLSLPMKNGAPREGAFDVWMHRTPQEQRGDCYYIREGMTITKISSNVCRRGC